jgi:hypothetical protein
MTRPDQTRPDQTRPDKLLIVAGIIFSAACSGEYDIVIKNGRVMEPETEFDSVRNVGGDGIWQNEGLDWDDDPAKFKSDPRTSGSHTITLRLARELIRYPVEDEPRFVEAIQEQWQEKMLVDDASISPRTN